MPFTSLPDDILLEVFPILNFRSIIALRQTCRRCFLISKTAALWLDLFRWLTKGSEDWRALLDDSPTSNYNEHLENLVTRMVRFEVNWNNARPQRIRYFTRLPGLVYVSALIPGGRWFLYSVDRDAMKLSYSDFDSRLPKIPTRVLIDHQEEQGIWAMDFAVDGCAKSFEFDLALEVAAKGKNMFSQKEIFVPGK